MVSNYKLYFFFSRVHSVSGFLRRPSIHQPRWDLFSFSLTHSPPITAIAFTPSSNFEEMKKKKIKQSITIHKWKHILTVKYYLLVSCLTVYNSIRSLFVWLFISVSYFFLLTYILHEITWETSRRSQIELLISFLLQSSSRLFPLNMCRTNSWMRKKSACWRYLFSLSFVPCKNHAVLGESLKILSKTILVKAEIKEDFEVSRCWRKQWYDKD